jgi:hypothetical protein
MHKFAVLVALMAIAMPAPALAVGTRSSRDFDIVRRAQKIAANDLRKQLPMKFENTTLFAATSTEGILFQSLIVDVPHKNINAAYATNVYRRNLVRHLCADNDARIILSMGGSYRFMYFSKEAIKFSDVLISKKSCIL